MGKSINRLHLLNDQIARLRGEPTLAPRASIVIPVNAKTDLENVLQVLLDISKYDGNHPVEIILIINNYADVNPPRDIEAYRQMGIHVIAIPKIERDSKIVSIPQAARIPGIQAAKSDAILLFDADCRIPHATDLIDWYVDQFEKGADLAYTHVDYFELPPGISVKVRMFIHHSSRWFRRAVLGLPTSRGSNYAIRKDLMLKLYSQGRVFQELSVGPAVRSVGGKIAYSGAKKLIVYTSGRFFSGGWKELFSYLVWRVGFYNRVITTKSKVADTDRQEV